MNGLIQMLMQNKLQQIPQGMMNQLEQQLKARNPQAFQEYQQARKNNVNPNEYLNKVTSRFNPQQKEQLQQMMNNINGVQNTSK